MRKGVDLIGVCPAAEITYPKLLKKQENELASGHTHFFLCGKDREDPKSKKVLEEHGLAAEDEEAVGEALTAGRLLAQLI